MDALIILQAARAAGLVISTADGQLHVRGPKSAEAYIPRLASQKEAIIALLHAAEAIDWRGDATRVIECITGDAHEQTALKNYFDECASAQNSSHHQRTESECQAFGILLTKILNLTVERGIEAEPKGVPNLTPNSAVTTIPGCDEYFGTSGR